MKSEEDDTENEEYEDFPQEPTLLQASYWTPQLYKAKPRSEVDQSQVFKVPAKRYREFSSIKITQILACFGKKWLRNWRVELKSVIFGPFLKIRDPNGGARGAGKVRYY